MADMSFMLRRSNWFLLHTPDTHNVPDDTSLVSHCARVIVNDRSATQHAAQVVPPELCYDLMRAALASGRDLAVDALVCAWPWHSLSLACLVPQLATTPACMYDDVTSATRMRRAVRCTTSLAHTFVECLKRRATTRLRCLDLTGFITAEVIVNYLASHVMLVHNELRQQQIIAECNELNQDLHPDTAQLLHNFHSTMPNDTFVVRLDTFIEKNDTHIELCRALRVSQQAKFGFKITVHHLDLSAMHTARVFVLLEQVDPQTLQGLSLQYAGLSQDRGQVIPANMLPRFHKLVALDLSCNGLSPSKDSTTRDQLTQALSQLVSLRRLDLSSTRLGNYLSHLLSSLPKPLHCLLVHACGLRPNDVHYLATSQPELCLLDLSNNNLSGLASEVAALLRHAPLSILETANCDLSAPDLKRLIACATETNIIYWNLAFNFAMNYTVLDECLCDLVKMPALAALHVTCNDDDIKVDDDIWDDYIGSIRQKLLFCFSTLCRAEARLLIKLQIWDYL